MPKRLVLVVLSAMLVGFTFLDKREKEEVTGSGVISVPKAFWPAFGLEYERKVSPRFSAAGLVSAGRYDPVLFRFFIRDTPVYQFTFDHWAIGARASWYALGDFHHGMFVGGTVRYLQPSYTGTDEVDDIDYNAVLHSVVAGPHLGYKIVVSPGLTAQVHAGVGYSYLSNAILTKNDLVTTDNFPDRVPPVATFGDLSLGWTF